MASENLGVTITKYDRVAALHLQPAARECDLERAVTAEVLSGNRRVIFDFSGVVDDKRKAELVGFACGYSIRCRLVSSYVGFNRTGSETDKMANIFARGISRNRVHNSVAEAVKSYRN